MANERKAYESWISRENLLLLQAKSYIEETVRSVKEKPDDYDSIDVLIDLLALTLVADVEAFLEKEYAEAFDEGIDGLADIAPDEAQIRKAVYAEVDGMNFAQRIRDYTDGLYAVAMLGPGRIDEAMDEVKSSLSALVATDGHRVRGAARQDAGEDLSTVGFDVTKTWRSMGDEKVRDTHFVLDGTTIGIDEYFHTVNGKALAPGMFKVAEEDCNCRCILEIKTV